MEEIIDANLVYTMRSLATTLGRTEKWVRTHVLHAGCACRRIGNTYFIAGRAFLAFIEAGAAPCVKLEDGGKRVKNLAK